MKSSKGWEVPAEVRVRSGWPPKGREWSGAPPEVWEGLGGPPEVREGLGGLPGSPGGVGRALRKSKRCREGSGGPLAVW